MTQSEKIESAPRTFFPMLIHHFLENAAARYPDKVGVIHDEERATYGQINAGANTIARRLSANGITKGEHVALLFENGIDFISAYYGSLKAGAVAAPLNPGLKPDNLQYLLDNLEPAAIIASSKTERLLRQVRFNEGQLKVLLIRNPKMQWLNTPFAVASLEERPTSETAPPPPLDLVPSDIACMVYTSGSTGKPKAAMLSHANICANTRSICEYLAISPADIQMVVLPFFYVMGLSLLNTHIAAGATLVINNRSIYPADMVHQMIRESVTSFSGVPSTYAYLLHRSPFKARRDMLSSLRYCSQAGGRMAPPMIQSLRQALPDHTRLFIMYGATEASARLTYLDPDFLESKTDSIGKPIPGVIIRLLDTQGREVPPMMEGELVAQGPNIMQGYWKDPSATKQVLTNHGYHTGDIGYRDSDGFLYIARRKDGLLKVFGHRVNPIEVEDFLLATHLLVEAAVIGVPDALAGTKLVALAAPKDNTCTPEMLKERCAAQLPKHQNPAEVILLRALPKNASGKIDRNKCIDLARK